MRVAIDDGYFSRLAQALSIFSGYSSVRPLVEWMQRPGEGLQGKRSMKGKVGELYNPPWSQCG
jgi:hypothetical protein